MLETTFERIPLGGRFFRVYKNYQGVPVEIEFIKFASDRYCYADYKDAIIHHVSGNTKVLIKKRLSLKVTEIWDDWTGRVEYTYYRPMEWFLQRLEEYGWTSIILKGNNSLELAYCEQGTLRIEYLKS